MSNHAKVLYELYLMEELLEAEMQRAELYSNMDKLKIVQDMMQYNRKKITDISFNNHVDSSSYVKFIQVQSKG